MVRAVRATALAHAAPFDPRRFVVPFSNDLGAVRRRARGDSARRVRARRGERTSMSEHASEAPLVLVTGATDGIGRETALELARQGARVLVHGRNLRRIEQTCEAIVALGRTPLPAPVQADFSSLSDVRSMVRELAGRRACIDVLVNNAGVYMKERQTSADGFEMTFAVNHLAPFLLTHLLLDGEVGRSLRRIVNVSSVAHLRGRLDLDDLGRTHARFDPYGAYAASKLANVLFTVELARRLGPRGITVNALHPGVVSTKLLTEGFEMHGPDSLTRGAATSVKLALAGDLGDVTGRYFVHGKETQMNPIAADRAFARRFYEVSAELVGVAPIRADEGARE